MWGITIVTINGPCISLNISIWQELSLRFECQQSFSKRPTLYTNNFRYICNNNSVIVIDPDPNSLSSRVSSRCPRPWKMIPSRPPRFCVGQMDLATRTGLTAYQSPTKLSRGGWTLCHRARITTSRSGTLTTARELLLPIFLLFIGPLSDPLLSLSLSPLDAPKAHHLSFCLMIGGTQNGRDSLFSFPSTTHLRHREFTPYQFDRSNQSGGAENSTRFQSGQRITFVRMDREIRASALWNGCVWHADHLSLRKPVTPRLCHRYYNTMCVWWSIW